MVEKRKGRGEITKALLCPANATLSSRIIDQALKKHDANPIRINAGDKELELQLTRFEHSESSCSCRCKSAKNRLFGAKPLWRRLDGLLAGANVPELADALVPERWMVDGRKQFDWLSQAYTGIRHGCWWWPAMQMLRRTFISTFASRKDGDQMDLLGSSADWRSMVVLVLAMNILLVHIFVPFRNHALNNFSTLAILLLVVLYVLKISGELKFFLLLFAIAIAAILLSLGSILKKQRKQKRWDTHNCSSPRICVPCAMVCLLRAD